MASQFILLYKEVTQRDPNLKSVHSHDPIQNSCILLIQYRIRNVFNTVHNRQQCPCLITLKSLFLGKRPLQKKLLFDLVALTNVFEGFCGDLKELESFVLVGVEDV